MPDGGEPENLHHFKLSPSVVDFPVDCSLFPLDAKGFWLVCPICHLQCVLKIYFSVLVQGMCDTCLCAPFVTK